MENKINIAELLKDCPRGMELDCTCADNVVFDKIIEYEQIKCVIGVCREPLILDRYGRLIHICCPKCVIFPKGKTTWEGFQRPFKDGDIVSFDNPTENHLQIFIFKDKKENNTLSSCYLMLDGDELVLEEDLYYATRLATEEEKEKLFDAIKANGYKWNAETKTLEKLIEPKFKVGDSIKNKTDKWSANRTIKSYDKNIGYFTTINDWVRIEDQDNWELVHNKFDITTLKAFDSRVLVRMDNNDLWKPAVFGFVDKSSGVFYVLGGNSYSQCIPYDRNEHLRGTTNSCDDFYKTWE